MKNIDLDNASVKKDAKDGLGRDEFSDHLFELIRCIDASAGAVVGLEGAWGSGKTTVLNGLKKYPKKPPKKLSEELTTNNKPIFIEFNPWMVSGADGLVEAVLLELLSALPSSVEDDEAKSRRELLRRLSGYSKALKVVKYASQLAGFAIPVLGEVVAEGVTKVEDAVKDYVQGVEERDEIIPSLSKRKKDVIESLGRLTHRFVMILDDVDRLPPNEVASIIQVVKAVADFPNVIYVLAYDPVIMARAIEVALKIEDGFSYLEKIVQLPVRLPRVPQNRFKSHVVERLGSVIPSGQAIDVREMEDIEETWSLVSLLLRTPRDVERLRTRLQVAIPVVVKEVNIADVILLEAMDIVHPEIIKWIDGESRNLMDGGLAKYDSDLIGKGYVSAPYCESEEDYEYRTMKEQEYDYNCELEYNEEVRKNGYKGSLGEYCEERGYYGYQDYEKHQEVRDRVVSMRKRLEEGWREKVSDENGCHVMASILKFLFPEIFVEGNKSSRSNVRRVQYYRFWYKWLCYHDHNDSWSFRDIENYVLNPMLIVKDGICADKNRFFELIGQILDLCDRGLVRFDSFEMAKVFESESDVIGWGGEGGWNNIYSSEMNALARFFVRDIDGRSSAMEVVIANTPVWFSCDLIYQFMEMIRSSSNVIVECEEDVIVECEEDVNDDPFGLGGWDFEPILNLWVDKVRREFSKESWIFQGRGRSPYELIKCLPDFGKSKIAAEFSREFLRNK